MEGGGGEFPMDEEEIPQVEAAPPRQEQEQVQVQVQALQMEHLDGGGELEALDVPPLVVEEEQPRAVVPGEEGDGGSTAAEVVVEDEGERGPAGVAEEGAVSFGVEVEDEDEVVDDEGPPGVAPLASASDAAVEGMEEEEPAVGGVPFVAEDAVGEQVREEGEGTEDDEPRDEEVRRGAVEEVMEEGDVSHGMEAEDEGFTAHENENAQLPALAPFPSDFVETEENEEANSLGHFAAVEDEVIADDDVAEEDEEEEEEAASAMAVEERELTASASGGRNRGGGRKKRGRPPKTQASRLPTKKKEEEDLCFICFDGGNLVVCDRRGCPKVYHPACVNRDESFFRSKGRWNCGWHICSVCEKAAHYMCLTCTYSLCKACIKEAEFVCARGNKGFCETCRSTVMLIETDQQEKKAGVDFDDRNSWMFLFKDYWLDLKRKLSLTLEEILKAKNPWKGPLAQNEESSDELYDAKDDLGSSSDSSSVRREGNKPARKKARRRSKTTAGDVEPVKLLNIESTSLPEDSEWASEELLEFVSHMRGGDKSVMCQFDVHTLLLEYIKQNNLRDPRKKSQIICDSRLEKLFAKARVGHFEMLKLLESHFLLKETSQAVTDDNQGGVVDPEFGQMDTEGNSEVVPRTGSEKKRKSRKKTEEREPQNNLDDYAAIDIHNISLIYLRRNLMEELLDDTENFSEKVLGSFVRIRISGAGQRQDMYRLVQVIGTGKAGEKYKTGKRTTDITLEILNLDKTEVICIDTISNQEFTEEECKRLRQSIKCGLLNRLTVRDVLEKAMALQAVRVNESLENEKMRLSHLRDRASEKGRRKELRECVEKLQLLNSPEERSRRLTDVPEIHADPNMDPNYESAEEESGDKRQDNFVRSTDSRFSRMGRELNPSPKGNMGSTDSWSGSRRGSASWESSKNLSTRGAWERVDTSSVPIDKVNEVTLNQVKDLYLANSWDPSKSLATAGVTETGIRGNGPDGTKSRQAQSLSSETVSTTQRDETAVQSNINENEKMWHYQDPSAKVQGPFSMTQLRKWNTTGYFPANLRIWRASEKQEESILLSDALVGKFRKEPPPPKMQNNTSTHLAKVAPAVVAREGNTTGNWRGNNESWVEKRKDEVGSSSGVWEPSKDANAWSSQPKVHAVPPPSVVPLSTNLDQASAHQARDRSGSNGRWKGGPSHGNSWGSHGPAAFHPSGHGYERQHSGFVYPGHQSPGEHLKGQAASSSNQWVNDSFNLPTPPPRPGGGWMGSQSIGNQPSASLNIAVQPAVSGWAGTAVGGGNSLQFPSVAINEASKVSAYVQQPPSAAGTLASWGSSTSLLKPTEMAANWNSSSTAPIAMVKESVLSDSLAGAHAPSLQNGPSATDRQTSSAQSPFNNDLTVTSCNFQKNMHMKDDCPSPTPKDEQAKFDALISETNQQSNIYVDPGKSLSPIRSVDSIQYPASAAASASMQMLNVLSVDQVNQSSQPASSTTNLPSNNEMSSTKSPSGLDDLGSLSYQKQIDVPSDPKYSSPSQEKASDFSQRKETESLVAKLPSEGDGLEQTPHTQNLQIFDPAKSGHLVLPAVRTDWSMPSPTPMIEPSVSHGGTDSALGVSTSSTQWNSSMQMQGTGNNEIRHHGVGISQENMNRGVEPGKESGHINHGVQGTTNAGLGAVMPANAGSVWANPPQANTNVNVGWCPPQQGNANMNMFWVALAQANPGWGSQLQANPNPNPNPNPGWVLTAPANTAAVSSWGTVAQPGNPNPNQVWGPATQSNANATSGWAVPQSNANPNAGWFGQGNVNVGSNASGANPGSWGAQLKQNADGYPAHSDRGFQNNDAGHGGGRHGWNRSQNSGGGGPSRGPPPRGQMAGICKYHESGHCKKGAHCNFLHT